MVYLQKSLDMEKQQRKIVHVHFLHGHKNYYFSSVSAVFRKFSEKELGVSETYIRHQLSSDGNHYINKKVIIIRSRLLT